jgi:hypothetical protein
MDYLDSHSHQQLSLKNIVIMLKSVDETAPTVLGVTISIILTFLLIFNTLFNIVLNLFNQIKPRNGLNNHQPV